ncbi:hypothetical protein [Paraburkholderia caledonica]|uniref:Uncharacterized protein n=1 Tax=Paraburkholderia caledonica TaxID=134536 RepID=A0ABU1KYQ0_9BURK|nr:hypothetical protein [Paraburkholderia caledonica]MDR6376098.1 hypothetical protein [Paraburkholderia caledonica]
MNTSISINSANRICRAEEVDDPALLQALVTCANQASAPVCATVATTFLPATLRQKIEESYVLAFAIPSDEDIDWNAQAIYALIPHNEVDFELRQATTLILLGDGPIAFEPSVAYQPLFGTDGSLFVLFLHRNRAILVHYGWNERFHCTLDTLDASAGDNHRHDEEMAARSIVVMRSPVGGAADGIALVPAAYFEAECDGSLSQYSASARARSRPELFAERFPDLCGQRDGAL